MSKSLEALKLLSECANGENKLIFSACLNLEQTIKQDLERLQQLEIADRNNTNLIKTNVDLVNKNLDLQKEISELKDKVAHFKEEFEGWQSAYEWSQAKNSILKLENQELSILKLKNQDLEEENQKLKKDYNLLDTTMESDDRIICELLKEKEQLKNDIKLNETQIDDLTLEVANYKHALEEKNEIIMDLKEENKELLIALENKNKEIGNLKKLIHDNPYRKAIEILKKLKIDIYKGWGTWCIKINDWAEIEEEQANLLKEVFSNE